MKRKENRLYVQFPTLYPNQFIRDSGILLILVNMLVKKCQQRKKKRKR